MLEKDQQRLAEELLFGEKKHPSFAKELFLGIFDNDQFLPFKTPDQDNLAEIDSWIARIKDFIEKNLNAKEIDQKETIPSHVIEGFAKLGVLSCTIPKEYGGLGLSQYAYCKAVELVSGYCGATALFINAHQSIGMKALLLFGTHEQKEKWLKKLASGTALAAFALTEPNAGSDASNVETFAKYDKEKKCYILNGRKQWITNGSIANILTVMAKCEDGKISAFLVTPDMKGFKVLDKSLEKVGMKGSTTSNLAFENMEVPEENILGEKGKGLRICLTCLDFGRVTFGAACTGSAKMLLKEVLPYAKTRVQFKKPLISFPLVKEKIANMHALTFAMESATYMTAGFVDEETEDFMLEAAIIKVFNSDALWKILYDTMQIFGGKSFFTSAPFERMMRDARLNMIGEGSNEVLRAFIGAVGLHGAGMELKDLKESSLFSLATYDKSFKFLKRHLFSPKIGIERKELKEEAINLSKAIRSFGIAVDKVLFRYREKVVDEQLILNRLTESVMSLYTMISVLSRLETAFQNNVLSPLQLRIGKYYCQMALKNIHLQLKDLFSKEDKIKEDLSDAISSSK